MKYFSKGLTINEVKKIYREKALELHPDKGGKTEDMQELNAEFDIAFSMAIKFNPETKETSNSFKREFYTQHGWAGSRYDLHLSNTEIAKIVREYIKNVYPTYKFSVTSNAYSISIALMEYPVELTNYERMKKYFIKTGYKRNTPFYVPSLKKNKYFEQLTEQEINEIVNYRIESSNILELNAYYFDEQTWMNPVIMETLKDIRNFLNSYRMDDSDAQIDYFYTNFYEDFAIGKSDKPAKLVEKTARISPTKGKKGAKRIEA